MGEIVVYFCIFICWCEWFSKEGKIEDEEREGSIVGGEKGWELVVCEGVCFR